jgi:hypothetical protein
MTGIQRGSIKRCRISYGNGRKYDKNVAAYLIICCLSMIWQIPPYSNKASTLAHFKAS